jgi:hypothetical protein
LLVFVADGTCAPKSYLAKKGGINFTEPLPSYDKWDTHKDTDLCEGFMKYTVEIGSDTTINMPNFIKIGSGIKSSIAGGFTDADSTDIA